MKRFPKSDMMSVLQITGMNRYLMSLAGRMNERKKKIHKHKMKDVKFSLKFLIGVVDSSIC
jgi:hypothetical protein